jgi:hypothetical protein
MKKLLMTSALLLGISNSAFALSFEDESCIVKAVSSLYNVESVDNKIQALRETYINSRDEKVQAEASKLENELDRKLHEVAYSLCN